MVSGIEAETDRLTLIVSNLLDHSRIEDGALKSQRDCITFVNWRTMRFRQTRRHAGRRQIVINASRELPHFLNIRWVGRR